MHRPAKLVAWMGFTLLLRGTLGAGAPPAEPPVRRELPASVVASPRLQALRAEVEGGDRGAVERFWREVQAKGTPLVEPAPGEPGMALVTFLWRGDRRTTGVYVLGSIARDSPMARLAGTTVWYRSYAVRRDARFTYRLAPYRGGLPLDPDAPSTAAKIRETAGIDPLNPRRHPPTDDPLLSVAELPDAPIQEWIAPRPGIPHGTVREETLASVALGGGRPLAIYTPPGYEAGKGSYPLLVVLDGSAYRTLVPLPTILDNLIAAGRIPPVVAALVGRLEADEREADLSCSAPFSRFLAAEILPRVRERYRIAPDPRRTLLVGSSLGGLAATCAALDHPGLFGGVLAQSGSFSWRPEGDSRFEAVRRRVETGPRLPIRLSLEVGLMETWPVAGDGPSLLESNRRLRDALQAKGYDIRYAEYAGGHGYANWQGTLADGLIWLLR